MKRIKSTEKRQMINLTKEDIRILDELQFFNKESFSKTISRALQSLYDSYNLRKEWDSRYKKDKDQ